MYQSDKGLNQEKVRLNVQVKTESLARLFYEKIKVDKIIAGQEYKIWFKVRNMSDRPYEGKYHAEIEFSRDRIEDIDGGVKLGPHQEMPTEKTSFRALSEGYTLVTMEMSPAAEFVHSDGKAIRGLVIDPDGRKTGATIIGGIHITTDTAIHTLWALTISAISLFIIALANLPTIIRLIRLLGSAGLDP